MNFKEWLVYMKEEWEFHKRHPELFVLWLTIAYALYVSLNEANP